MKDLCALPEKQRHQDPLPYCSECEIAANEFALRRWGQLRSEADVLYAVEAVLVTALADAAADLRDAGRVEAGDRAFQIIAEVRSRAHFLLPRPEKPK